MWQHGCEVLNAHYYRLTPIHSHSLQLARVRAEQSSSSRWKIKDTHRAWAHPEVLLLYKLDIFIDSLVPQHLNKQGKTLFHNLLTSKKQAGHYKQIIKQYTYRVDSFMLREAHRGNTIDSDSQDGNEQMDKCDPVGKEGPGQDRKTVLYFIYWDFS